MPIEYRRPMARCRTTVPIEPQISALVPTAGYVDPFAQDDILFRGPFEPYGSVSLRRVTFRHEVPVPNTRSIAAKGYGESDHSCSSDRT